MQGVAQPPVRLAGLEDIDSIGRLLHDFNREFGEPTPSPSALADCVRQLLHNGDTAVLLVGDGPDGLAVLRSGPPSGPPVSSATWRSSTSFPIDAGKDWGELSWSKHSTRRGREVPTPWRWVSTSRTPLHVACTRASASRTGREGMGPSCMSTNESYDDSRIRAPVARQHSVDVQSLVHLFGRRTRNGGASQRGSLVAGRILSGSPSKEPVRAVSVGKMSVGTEGHVLQVVEQILVSADGQLVEYRPQVPV